MKLFFSPGPLKAVFTEFKLKTLTFIQNLTFEEEHIALCSPRTIWAKHRARSKSS